MKKSGFPTKEFKTQQEYFDFVDIHKVFGADAIALKKKLDKKNHLPEPRIGKKL